MAAWGSAMALKSGGMFAASVMAGIADVAVPVLRLVSVEMVERLFPAGRIGSVVAVTRIVAVVDMPIKSVRAVEPGAGPDEHPTSKPIRPVVPIRSTVIRRVIVISIGTDGCLPDIHSYRDL